MKCVDCQDLLAEYALDSLEPREAQQVAEHLAAGCAECQQHLDETREAWAALAGSLPPAPPPPQLKADVLARVRAESKRSSLRWGHGLTPEPEPVSLSRRHPENAYGWRWQSLLPYVAATLCGVALGFLFARNSATDSALVDRYHAQLVQAERMFGAPQMRYAALRRSDSRPDIRGYLILDSVAGELHVYAFDLQPPPDGSVYRLWFVTDDENWIPAGDLAVGPDGVCSAVLAMPQLAKPASRVAVTTEPTVGANADDQAHGPVGLTGEWL
jgi:anti-sigma-K factor RskA